MSHKSPALLLALLACCTSPPSEAPASSAGAAMRFLESLGDAAVRMDGTAALLKYAPEAMALVDTSPKDGVVTLAELTAVVNSTQDPAQLVWLIVMVRGMIEARN